MPKEPTLAVIFDLDGTVADTQWIHADIEVELLAEYGILKCSEELTVRFSGVSLQETFRAIFAEACVLCPDLDEMSERKMRMLHARASEFRPMPGILELTESLMRRRIPLAIASASRLVTIELVLESLKIRNRFRVITSTKEVDKDKGKPAPDVFLLAAKRLEVPPRNCVVIEDGVSGMMGAKAAGMRCIALWQHPRRQLPVNLVVTDIREIPNQFF